MIPLALTVKWPRWPQARLAEKERRHEADQLTQCTWKSMTSNRESTSVSIGGILRNGYRWITGSIRSLSIFDSLSSNKLGVKRYPFITTSKLTFKDLHSILIKSQMWDNCTYVLLQVEVAFTGSECSIENPHLLLHSEITILEGCFSSVLFYQLGITVHVVFSKWQ